MTSSRRSNMILHNTISTAQSRLRIGKLSSMKRSSPSSRREIPPTSNGWCWYWVCSGIYWCFHYHQIGGDLLKEWSQNDHHLCLFCWYPLVCDRCEPQKYKNSHQIVSIVSCASSCVPPTAGYFITLCEDVSLFYLLRHLIGLIKSWLVSSCAGKNRWDF